MFHLKNMQEGEGGDCLLACQCLPTACCLALRKTADLAFFPSPSFCSAAAAVIVVVAVQRTSSSRRRGKQEEARSFARRFYLVNCAREHERLATPRVRVRSREWVYSPLKGLYMVARIMLLLNCSAWPCPGPA